MNKKISKKKCIGCNKNFNPDQVVEVRVDRPYCLKCLKKIIEKVKG